MKNFNEFFDGLYEIVEKGLSRKTDPVTSKEAAASISPNKLEIKVLMVIKSFSNGCTLQDIELALPELRPSSISPRIKPLMIKGLIYDTGQKRPGFSGRNQRVIKAVL
jgi:hypothetical protein